MTKNLIYIYLFSGFLFSCSMLNGTSKKFSRTIEKPFDLQGISDDPTYGLTPENPIQVGGVKNGSGAANERRYLNALTGPNGKVLKYYRAGSCCPFKSKNALFGDHVLLDKYIVKWKGSKETKEIYINMYDKGILKAPVGFKIYKPQ